MSAQELRDALDHPERPPQYGERPYHESWWQAHDTMKVAARNIALPILEGSPEVREAIKAHWYAATPETMVEAILRELAALTDTEKE